MNECGMAETSNFNAGQFLLWETAAPSHSSPCESPHFYFQNVECWFELAYTSGYYSCENHYELRLNSMNCHQLSQPFNFTGYIVKSDCGATTRRFFDTVSVSKIPTLIAKLMDDYPRERIKIGMIFEGEVGTSLHVVLERGELFRIFSVETNVEPDATSPSSTHSTLQILSNDFSKLLDEDLYHDVELQCEDKTFKAHKSVLSTRSKVFLAMLRSNMIEGQTARVEVKDMKSNVFTQFLRYMYTGNLPELTSENARGLYEAGDRYNVGGLMKPCARFLTNNLKPDNACEMLVLADAHSDQDFKERVIKYILDQKIPLKDDQWQPFCRIQPLLAIEVYSGHYKLQYKK